MEIPSKKISRGLKQNEIKEYHDEMNRLIMDGIEHDTCNNFENLKRKIVDMFDGLIIMKNHINYEYNIQHIRDEINSLVSKDDLIMKLRCQYNYNNLYLIFGQYAKCNILKYSSHVSYTKEQLDKVIYYELLNEKYDECSYLINENLPPHELDCAMDEVHDKIIDRIDDDVKRKMEQKVGRYVWKMLIGYLNYKYYCDQVDQKNIDQFVAKMEQVLKFELFNTDALNYTMQLRSLINKLKNNDYKNVMKMMMSAYDCRCFIPLIYIIRDLETFTIFDFDKRKKYECYAYILMLYDKKYAYVKKDFFEKNIKEYILK